MIDPPQDRSRIKMNSDLSCMFINLLIFTVSVTELDRDALWKRIHRNGKALKTLLLEAAVLGKEPCGSLKCFPGD